VASFDQGLSTAIDRAIIGKDTSTGLRRLYWRLILRWLERQIP
jgi:hypothetical protein